ncbi:MAG: prepilin-type N-terminal cleavage/methylation domain-containing protein [Candidatus Omnitrophica bacterium]|nr:prepilin-type N-terminal cleavage/methylation domain-containing protein [Candidatus Omnitrophota bacterium]
MRNRKVTQTPSREAGELGNWETGFTLIELLITISILSIVMIAVYSTFALGVNTYQRFKDVNIKERKVILSLEKMGDELRQCLDFSDIGFGGDSQGFSFPLLSGGEIAKVAYSFNPEEKILYRQEQLQKEILAGEEESPLQEFLSSVQKLNFSYYRFDEEEEGYCWVNNCEESQPLFVQIEIIFANEVFNKTILLPCANQGTK